MSAEATSKFHIEVVVTHSPGTTNIESQVKDAIRNCMNAGSWDEDLNVISVRQMGRDILLLNITEGKVNERTAV